MGTIFYTKIEVKTIAKNGSEKFGATAECKMWTEGSKLKMDVCQNGKTKLEAEVKLLQFLSDNGANKLELVFEIIEQYPSIKGSTSADTEKVDKVEGHHKCPNCGIRHGQINDHINHMELCNLISFY